MRRIGFFFLLCFVLGYFDYGFAEDIPVKLKADKLKYNQDTKLIEAVGSVEVQFQKFKIYSDRLWMDPTTNIATAEGHVKMFSPEYSALADALTLDTSTEVSDFSNYRAKIHPDKVQGDLFLNVAKCTNYKNRTLGLSGSVTSCDKELPHYFAMADRVEYYPDESVIAHNATLYVGEIPTFWLPYIYYDLHAKRKRSWDFGHNEVEGDFVKTVWNYPGGTLLLDYMSKKGFGEGINTNYVLGGLGLGALYLYHVDEADTGITDWIAQINHSKQINDWMSLKFNSRLAANYLVPSGRSDQTTNSFILNYNKDVKWNLNINSNDDRMASYKKYALQFTETYKKLSTNYDWTYENDNASSWLRSSQRLTVQTPLWSDKVNFRAHANYYNNVTGVGTIGDERFEPDFEMNGSEKDYSWTIKGNWYVDPDKDANTIDNTYQYLERSPELTVRPNAIKFGIVNLNSSLGYGHYREVRYVAELGRNRDFSSDRASASLGANTSFPAGPGTTASINLGLDQYFYTPGDQLYAWRESGSLNTSLFGFFRNSLSYTKGTTDGNTPFLFDQLNSHYHNCSESMTFYNSNTNWTTTSGYNWQAHRWIDVLSSLSMRPSNNATINLRSGWDIENRCYKDLVSSLHYVPVDFFTVDLSSTQDLNNGALKYGNVLYDLFALKGQPNQWHFKFSQVYDTASQQFKVRDIMVVKDLHCWELKYSYSDWLKQFTMTFSLKAMPDQPIGYTAGRGVYFDGFDRELKKMLNELNPNSTITRY
ncbi:MAG: hypothetical protein WC890_07040 [Candidatus Margulisiibacteriota bacterium]